MRRWCITKEQCKDEFLYATIVLPLRPMHTTDYLIVGQNLSGSILALTLLRAGKTVHVLDAPALSACSRVAAGVYNPFNFRRMVNTWEAETLTPFAIQFYNTAAAELGVQFHHPRPIWRLLADTNERILWEKACAEREGLFADPNILYDPLPGILHAPHGIGVVLDSGNLDAAAFIAAVKQLLISRNALTETVFDPQQLTIAPDGVSYAGRFKARQLVSCEGIRAMHNPLFSFLPLIPVKGQLLHLNIPGLHLESVLSRGDYLLPVGNEQFVCGATYERDLDDEINTEEARDVLLDKLRKSLRAEITVTAQLSGVRPGVRDRRPLLGRHPQHPAIAIFNGMGSKAVLLAPWLATQLVAHLETDAPLPREANLNRFRKK